MILRRSFFFLSLAIGAVIDLAPASSLEVTGRVTDLGGAPLAGAQVLLSPQVGAYDTKLAELAGVLRPPAKGHQLARARGDAEGLFRISVPEPGFFSLTVQAKGRMDRKIRLAPILEDRELGDVRLDPAAFVDLRVEGPEGAPLEGAWAAAWDPRLGVAPEGDSRGLRSALRRLTDARGRVEVPRSIFAERSPVKVVAFALGYPEAQQEKVAGKAILRLRPGLAQVVEVRNEKGRGVAAAVVLVGEGRWAAGTTGEDGRLRIALAAGVRTPVSVVAPDGRRHDTVLMAARGAAGKEKPTPVVIELPAWRPLTGRVVEAGAHQPVAGALVWLGGHLETLGRTDSQGRFRLQVFEHRGADPRAHSLRVAAPGYLPGAQSVATGVDVLPDLVMQPGLLFSGRVVNTAGEPVGGVEMRAFYDRSGSSFRPRNRVGQTARTGEDGRFVLRRLVPRSSYELEFHREGYAPLRQRITAPRFGEPFHLEVVLETGRRAFGQVVDLAGQPVPGAGIALFEQAKGQDVRRLVSNHRINRPAAATTTSDGEGHFKLLDLAPGRYRLQVTAAGFAPALVSGLGLPQETPVEGFDLGLVSLEPGVSLEGRVVAGQGKPLAQVEVHAARYQNPLVTPGELNMVAVTGDDGTFSLSDLRAGERLTLSVLHPGFLPVDLYVVARPGGESRDEPLLLTLRPAGQIAGRVIDGEGNPIGRAVISVRGEGLAFETRGDESDEEGRFAVAELGAGTMEVEVRAGGYRPTKLQGIRLAAGEEVSGLEITLERGALEVSGSVLDEDERPVEGAHVLLAFGTSSSNLTTDAGGHFQGTLAEPGVYELKVYHREYLDFRQVVHLAESGAPLEVRLRKGQTVEGQVIDKSGQAVAGAAVWLTQEQPMAGHRSGTTGGRRPSTTDREGMFTIERVSQGVHKVFADHPEYSTTAQDTTVTVAAEPVVGLQVQLERGTTVRGRITGLTVDELARLEILASSAPQIRRTGEVDFEGKYSIPHLGPGIWEVLADLSGRAVAERVEVPAGSVEVALDLDFGAGFTLGGRVLRGGEPVVGVTISIQGLATVADRSVWVDPLGRYEVRSLPAGRYLLRVMDARYRPLLLRREFTLDEDLRLDLTLEQGRLQGRVIDAATSEPLVAVVLTAKPVFEDATTYVTPSENRSGSLGEIDLELVPGIWRLRAAKEGYGTKQVEVEVPPGATISELELALEPTAGLWLTVSRPGGSAAGWVSLALFGEDGALQALTRVMAGEDGRVHFANAPVGRGWLLVGAERAAIERLRVSVPTDAPHVVSRPGATLDISVPEITRNPARAEVRLTDAAGYSFQAFRENHVTSGFPLQSGHTRIENVPAGQWAVEVRASDDRTWSERVVVEAGGSVELRLE